MIRDKKFSLIEDNIIETYGLVSYQSFQTEITQITQIKQHYRLQKKGEKIITQRFIIGNSKNGTLNCNNILFKGSKITSLNICGKYILELENIQSMYRRIDFDVNSETHGNQFKLMPLLMRLTCFMRFPRFCRIYSCSPPMGFSTGRGVCH